VSDACFRLGDPSLGTGKARYFAPDTEVLRFWPPHPQVADTITQYVDDNGVAVKPKPWGDLTSLLTPRYLERWSGDIVTTYAGRKGRDWQPIPFENWRLAVFFEFHAKKQLPPPRCLANALAYALGIEADIGRVVQILDAALRRVEADVFGPPQTDAQIATAMDVSVRKLAMLKREPAYAEFCAMGRANFVQGSQRVNVHPGDEFFLDGDAEWQSRSAAIAEDIIRQWREEGTLYPKPLRYPPNRLRLSLWALVNWHVSHQRPISPSVVKAAAYLLGLVNLKTGKMIRHVDPVALAGADARAVAWPKVWAEARAKLGTASPASLPETLPETSGGELASPGSVARGLGVSRMAIVKTRATHPEYLRALKELTNKTNR
jgi:hypothetical protein